MLNFIIRRVIATIIIVFIVSIICFMLIQLIPGDPAVAMLGYDANQAQIDALRKELWLDRPILVQYIHWISNVLQGDFGRSIVLKEEVTTLMIKRSLVTGYISLWSIILSAIIGVGAGVICAVRRGGILDQFISMMANIGIAIPIFWLGILGIYAFGLGLHWLPIQGYTSPTVDFWKSTRQLIMPLFCLVIVGVGLIMRQTRSSMLEIIQQDYIRTAWAKGLGARIVYSVHALKNALIPVVTLLGLHVRFLIGGSVFVEQVFNIPGMGRLLTQAVLDKDFFIVQAEVFFMAIVVGLVNLLVDISYGWLDPRIRYE